MKTDKYLKIILTVIAAALTVIVLQNANIIPAATASKTTDYKFVAVPINQDGTVDVNVKSFSSSIDVNVKQIGGFSTFGDIPVTIKDEVKVIVKD